MFYVYERETERSEVGLRMIRRLPNANEKGNFYYTQVFVTGLSLNDIYVRNSDPFTLLAMRLDYVLSTFIEAYCTKYKT